MAGHEVKTKEDLLRLIDRAADEGWTELDLAGLGLEELPGEIGKLERLERLILGKWDNEKGYIGNKLKTFPEAILQLQSLQHLELAANQISEIPEAIAQLSSLQSLSLSSNQISEIPDAIAQLSSLQSLSLINNQISEIPDAIAQLSSLQSLSLINNQISEIPDAIAQLSSLQSLDRWVTS